MARRVSDYEVPIVEMSDEEREREERWAQVKEAEDEWAAIAALDAQALRDNEALSAQDDGGGHYHGPCRYCQHRYYDY